MQIAWSPALVGDHCCHLHSQSCRWAFPQGQATRWCGWESCFLSDASKHRSTAQHYTAMRSPPSFLTWWGLGEHSARPGVEAACLVFTLAHFECHDNQTTSIGEKHCRHSWLLQGSCAKQEAAPHFGRSIIWEDQDLYDHVWSIRVSFLPHPRATGFACFAGRSGAPCKAASDEETRLRKGMQREI